jgi:hypothetical protein
MGPIRINVKTNHNIKADLNETDQVGKPDRKDISISSKQWDSLILTGLHVIGNPTFSPLLLVCTTRNAVKHFAPTTPCVNHQRDEIQQEI